MRTVVTRFAPSPTGRLHLGHAYAAWFAWNAARRPGGHFLLRIEDIDAARCRPAYADAIREDLAWLGLAWEGPVLVQSERLPAYASALARLRDEHLLYPCFCSRTDIRAALAAPQGPGGAPVYPGTCRARTDADRQARIAAGDPHAWRLDIAAALHRAGPLTWREGAETHPVDLAGWGDPILGRRDIPASYHLCATLDDAAQGVTLVTRAEDLRPAAPLHRLLQALFGWPAPAYAHHTLLRDAGGARLAKRAGARAIADLRDAGMSAAECLARASALAAHPPAA